MEWAEWAKTYPARKVTELPNYMEGEDFDDYLEAVEWLEGLETLQEIGGFEIVEYQERFYIISS